MSMKYTLPDGVYQVTTKYFCAGFVVKAGQITVCAPILKNKLAYWQTVAKRVDITKSLRYSNPHLRILSDAALAEKIAKSVKSNCAVEGIKI